MEPTEKQNIASNVKSKEGQIDIVSTLHSQEFNYGISFSLNKEDKYVGGVFNSDSDFHIYAIEWTESEIKWMFDSKPLFTASIEKELLHKYNPFDQSFRLRITLDLEDNNQISARQMFNEFIDNDQNRSDRPCSLLILDYVRVYEKTYENVSNDNIEDNNKTVSQICENIMTHIKSEFKEEQGDGSSFSLIAIISISSFALLLALILLNIFLFIRLKKRKKSTPDKEEETYDDIDMDDYDKFVDNDYTYANDYSNEYANANEYAHAPVNNEYAIEQYYETLEDETVITGRSDEQPNHYLPIMKEYEKEPGYMSMKAKV